MNRLPPPDGSPRLPFRRGQPRWTVRGRAPALSRPRRGSAPRRAARRDRRCAPVGGIDADPGVLDDEPRPPASARGELATLPPAGVYLTALSTRFRTARRSAPPSPWNAGAVARRAGHAPCPGEARAHLERFEARWARDRACPGGADGRRGSREEQQVLGDPDEEVDLLEGGVEDPPVLVRRAPRAKGHLHLTLEGGERRAQLVRRVGREAAASGRRPPRDPPASC